MEGFFSTTLGIIISLAGIVGTVILGILFVLGLYDTKKKERNKDVDGQEDRLINLLKETEAELNKKLAKQKEEHDKQTNELTEEVHKLRGEVGELRKENNILTEVLQGRDKQTQLFYTKAFEAMEIGNKSYALLEAMSKTQTELMKVLADHLKASVTINNQPTQPVP